MFLQAPKSGQVPKPNRSPKGAFTNRPPPKIKKFVPPNDNGDEDDVPSKPKVRERPPDSAFMAWLREKQTSHAVHVNDAKDYVLEGAPFKGESTFDAKEAVKELGGGWCANPDKRKDCEDKSIRRGWFAANDETVLLRLLRLKNDDRGRRQWTPLGMGSTQINLLLTWLNEFFGSAPESASDSPYPEAKRPRNGPKAATDETPQWIIDYNARYVHVWFHDTKCVACDEWVTDQFLDCGCGPGVKWERCAKCGAKYRTDFRTRKGCIRNANAWCVCKGKH